MRKDPFVTIKTLYGDRQYATLDFLSSIYENSDLLDKTIRELLEQYVEGNDILGKKVLLKPNWVREDIAPDDPICLRTNDSLLISVIRNISDYAPSKIMVADAPVQNCSWDLMLHKEVKDEINKISAEKSIPIVIKDLRRVKTDFHSNTVQRDCSGLDNYLIFDMGNDSNLEPITSEKNSFRVTNYDPDKMAKVHTKGIHKYCIAREVFDYDVIITIPKIKTHRMAGLTNSLKILVGINGDKDFLPHHRIGAKESGGDCYKGRNPLRHLAEVMADAANRRIGKPSYYFLRKMATASWYLSLPGKKRFMNAGWYGNDTIWRTVLDINHIAVYGKSDGSIAKVPQRQLLTICDGIVGGQGDGPLHPQPLPLGIVAFSNNSYLMDVVAGVLMGIEVDLIPLLKAAKTILGNVNYSIFINNQKAEFKDLKKYSVKAQLPPGWVDYNKEKE